MSESTATALCLNEDNSHFYFTRAGREPTTELVDQWVDQYAGTQVRELLLSPNCMRTSCSSRVWDPIWRGYDPSGPDDQPLLASLTPSARKSARGWIHTAWALDQAGIDVYERWIRRAREHGLAPWLSVRMNDVHDVNDEACYIHSELWRARPDLRRVRYRFARWTDRAFDYAQPEVREHHLALIRELVSRYDPDGIELDWMRFGYHFRPGFESEGVEILSRFTEEVRRTLDAAGEHRGRRMGLWARVPSRPETSLGLGMDASGWAKSGLIDGLVVTPFWASVETDMPVEIWRRLLEGTGVLLCAGLEVLIRPDPATRPLMNSLETVRGAAAAFLDRGVDRVYLFNYMDSQTAMADLHNYPALLREAGSLATLAGKPRRHVVTFADTWAPGEPQGQLLPASCAAGDWKEFRLHTGPVPAAGEARVVLCVTGGAEPEVYLNGTRCAARGEVAPPAPRLDLPSLAWSIPAGALKPGPNLVEVRAVEAITIRWVEIALGQFPGWK
jgi:hypothetical protein